MKTRIFEVELEHKIDGPGEATRTVAARTAREALQKVETAERKTTKQTRAVGVKLVAEAQL